MADVTYVAISGLIGSSKSTALESVIEAIPELRKAGFDGGVTVIPENVSQWRPLLAKFYEDPQKYAGYVQIKIAHHFKAVHQTVERLKGASASRLIVNGPRPKHLVVSERCHGESGVFVNEARESGNMDDPIYDVYLDTCKHMNMSDITPDHILYMEASPVTCIERCRQRARGCETGISGEYMESLWSRYPAFLNRVQAQSGSTIHHIDAEGSRHAVSQQVISTLTKLA